MVAFYGAGLFGIDGLLGISPTASTTCITNPYISTSTIMTSTSTTGVSFVWPSGTGDGQDVIFVVDEDDYVTHQEYFALARARGVAFRIRTAEEKRLAAEAEARRAEEAKARCLAQEAARVRARELLFEHLTEEQRYSMEHRGWFVVVGGKTGMRYRIRTHGTAGNIDVLGKIDGDLVMHRLCCHCSHDIPHDDQFLAQKLALEHDEQRFLGIANRQAA